MEFNYPEWKWLHVLCKDMNRARSLTVWLLVSNCEWDQLVNLRCSPSDYVDLRSLNNLDTVINLNHKGFRYDYQITELLRKCSDLPVSVDPTDEAIKSFWAAEDACRVTNLRLYNLRKKVENPCYRTSKRDQAYVNFVHELQDTVKDILGPIPDDFHLRFSSGSTYDDRRYIFVQDKMTNRPTVTASAYDILSYSWSKTLWSKSLCAERPNSSLPKIILGNRFTTVPKTAVTDRGICVEPSLNVTHQLSVGRVLRSRLRRRGIDLKFGQATHQRLVESASIALDLGTIDLSSASDSVSIEFVKLCLGKSPMWYDLLDSLRSPFTKIGGHWHKNEKFSSMGNGFTFELETLLFYALAVTLCRVQNYNWRVISVYGDDIIIDTPMAEHMTRALRFFGFTLNAKKTYINGIPFRESCGADFYMGQPVRGHYLENLPKEPTDWIKLANGIRRMARSDLTIFGRLNDYHNSWNECLRHIPIAVKKIRGPESLGDIVIHDDSWRSVSQIRYEGGRSYIKACIPQFSDRDRSSYDRKFWTRGSILGAAVGGYLKGLGDRVVVTENDTRTTRSNTRVIKGTMLRARSVPIGYQIKWIEYTTATSEWLPS